MRILAKLLNIKSKPRFEKITKYGHYDVTPYSFKKVLESKVYPKKSTDIKKGLIDLIKNLN